MYDTAAYSISVGAKVAAKWQQGKHLRYCSHRNRIPNRYSLYRNPLHYTKASIRLTNRHGSLPSCDRALRISKVNIFVLHCSSRGPSSVQGLRYLMIVRGREDCSDDT